MCENNQNRKSEKLHKTLTSNNIAKPLLDPAPIFFVPCLNFFSTYSPVAINAPLQ